MRQYLKYLLISIEETNDVKQREAADWLKEIRKSGIEVELSDKEKWPDCSSRNCMIITDKRETAKNWSAKGYVCIGLDPMLDGFFDGAETVAAELNDLDAIYMEETLLRAQGRPVTIAETGRIRIREIGMEDIPALYKISRQEDMHHAFAEDEMVDCFAPERMEAYIAMVYRYYGYGLWTVETLDGTIIGCCGLSDLPDMWSVDSSTEVECTDSFEKMPKLELQYMVASSFQRQGYGEEMCRAVLRYARERLPEYEVCIRVKATNSASVRLAEKLGFVVAEKWKDDVLFLESPA